MTKRINIFGKIAQVMLWVLVTMITLLEYAVEIRAFFYSFLGAYWAGLMDGIVLVILVLIAVFFIISKSFR